MKPNKGKLLSGSQSPFVETSSTNGSHDVTLDSNSWSPKFPSLENEVQSSEYHLTARITNSSLSLRDLSLVLDVLCYQVVNFGANLGMLLALYELYSRVLGNARSSEDISDGRIRKTVSVSEIIIGALKDKELSLYSGELVQLSDQIKELLRPYLMTKRTYSSRYQCWRPEKLIVVKAVPVDTLFERTSSSNKRYSGYTKGYGESHGNAHRQKTKPNSLLDGEANRPDKVERNLFLRMFDQLHQEANQLWIKFRNLKEKS